MKNLKMKTKIVICFIIPVLFLVLTVAMAISSMSKIDKTVEGMMDDQISVLEQKMEEIGADEAKAETILETMVEARADEMKSVDNTISLSEKANVLFVVVAVIIVIEMSLTLINDIVKSVEQLSNAAKDIALCKVYIHMLKYNNDEFG